MAASDTSFSAPPRVLYSLARNLAMAFWSPGNKHANLLALCLQHGLFIFNTGAVCDKFEHARARPNQSHSVLCPNLAVILARPLYINPSSLQQDLFRACSLLLYGLSSRTVLPCSTYDLFVVREPYGWLQFLETSVCGCWRLARRVNRRAPGSLEPLQRHCNNN
jgi:hypothetical protein